MSCALMPCFSRASRQARIEQQEPGDRPGDRQLGRHRSQVADPPGGEREPADRGKRDAARQAVEAVEHVHPVDDACDCEHGERERADKAQAQFVLGQQLAQRVKQAAVERECEPCDRRLQQELRAGTDAEAIVEQAGEQQRESAGDDPAARMQALPEEPRDQHPDRHADTAHDGRRTQVSAVAARFFHQSEPRSILFEEQ